MSSSNSKYVDQVETIAREVVAAQAAEVDASGRFPQAALDALGRAGVLGLISATDVGGLGGGPRDAAWVVERLARECGSTAMVVCMHYAGTAVIEKLGPVEVRKDIAAGRHLSTLAFSEAGSRSQFWAPVSSATASPGGVTLQARKSWVTSASHATAYVWSSKPVAADGASTLWLVPRDSRGLRPGAGFDGLGLRGNDSTPVTAEDVVIPESARLGADGGGLAVMLETVLPLFNLLSTASAVGFMESATTRACAHAAGTRFEHSNEALAALPTVRAFLARMRIATDSTRCLMLDTVDALERGRADAMLRVLSCKAAGGEQATAVTDLAMRVCGGVAFRKEVGIERIFRDARAAQVMAPTTDQLYDFLGKAICGLPVF